MKQDYFALVAGGAGGIFTSVYDKASWLVNGGIPPWTIGQLLGLLVFFVLGAGLAWLFEEDNRRKAFFVGLGLPAFLTAAQTQAGPTVEQSAALRPGFGLFATAYAQERAAEAEGDDEVSVSAAARTLTVRPAPDHTCPEGTLQFYAEMQEIGGIPLSCDQAMEVPPEATHFGISTAQSNPNRFELSEAEAATYELRYDYNFWTDLRAGLGARSLRAYDLLLTPITDPEEPEKEKPPEGPPLRHSRLDDSAPPDPVRCEPTPGIRATDEAVALRSGAPQSGAAQAMCAAAPVSPSNQESGRNTSTSKHC